MSDLTQLLFTIRQVIPLNDAEAGVIGQVFQPLHLSKGDYFVQQGQVCRQVGFINQGLLRYYINRDGEEKIYDFGKENDFTCDYQSFLPQQPCQRNIQAVEDTDLLVVSHADLQRIFTELTHGERFGRLMAEQLFVTTIGQVTSLYTDSAEERYQAFLRQYPTLQTRLPQYFIASYVGVKPQSLSRIRARWAGKLY